MIGKKRTVYSRRLGIYFYCLLLVLVVGTNGLPTVGFTLRKP